MSAIRQLLNRVKTEGARRSGTVTTVSMGRERTFEAFDIGDDTFVLEKGVVGHLGERPSVLLVEKRQLRRRTKGRVMTLSTGNHAVSAVPVLEIVKSAFRTAWRRAHSFDPVRERREGHDRDFAARDFGDGLGGV